MPSFVPVQSTKKKEQSDELVLKREEREGVPLSLLDCRLVNFFVAGRVPVHRTGQQEECEGLFSLFSFISPSIPLARIVISTIHLISMRSSGSC